jgi:hypothetical protein
VRAAFQVFRQIDPKQVAGLLGDGSRSTEVADRAVPIVAVGAHHGTEKEGGCARERVLDLFGQP